MVTIALVAWARDKVCEAVPLYSQYRLQRSPAALNATNRGNERCEPGQRGGSHKTSFDEFLVLSLIPDPPVCPLPNHSSKYSLSQ